MIYIYRSQPSNSARALVEALGARRLRNDSPLWRRVTNGDHIVCWGDGHVRLDGINALNGAPIQNKFQDALKLREAGVPTVEVARERPPIIEQDEPLMRAMAWDALTRTGVQNVIATLQQWLADNPPAAPAPEWLGRSRNHVGGRDLLNPVERPDYYVRKEEIVREFRVHSFRGSSIRAGVKKAASEHAHAWIRSLDAGWRISYDGVTIRQVHREIAHAAVTSLGLDFGAVDIAERQDGSLIVLEVNRAPGLDGGTITAYAEAIRKWVVEG
jgi:hypothetical protein